MNLLELSQTVNKLMLQTLELGVDPKQVNVYTLDQSCGHTQEIWEEPYLTRSEEVMDVTGPVQDLGYGETIVIINS